MPRGRKPAGDRPLTGGERQVRYRSRHHVAPPAIVRPRKAIARRSRPQRWHDAVAELLALQADYAAWLEALPETLHSTAAAEASQAIVELDLEALVVIERLRGYGRN